MCSLRFPGIYRKWPYSALLQVQRPHTRTVGTLCCLGTWEGAGIDLLPSGLLASSSVLSVPDSTCDCICSDLRWGSICIWCADFLLPCLPLLLLTDVSVRASFSILYVLKLLSYHVILVLWLSASKLLSDPLMCPSWTCGLSWSSPLEDCRLRWTL